LLRNKPKAHTNIKKMNVKICQFANCSKAKERTQTTKAKAKTKKMMLDKIFMIKLFNTLDNQLNIPLRFVLIQNRLLN